MSQTKYDAPALNIEFKDDYAIVQLNNGKVNALNNQILGDLKNTFRQLKDDDNVKGAILTGRPNVFSAGLDVMSLAMMDENGHLEFWENYMHAMQAIVDYPKPLVCAISGYAPAGATILVLCTDYRIMAKGPKHVVGMHEFKMHMQIPELLCDVYAYFLGEMKAWKAIQQAKLFNSDEALTIGLVDESVEVDEVIPRAEAYLKKQMVTFHKVFAQSKKWFRKDLRRIVMDADVPALARQTVDFNKDPELQAKVVEFMMQLKGKK